MPSPPSNLQRFPLAALFVVLAAIVSAVPSAASVEVVGARHWIAPDHTRIVVDLSGESTWRHHVRENPTRIVVEIDDARFAKQLDPVDVAGGVIERVRFNTLSKSHRAQIVVDLSEILPYDVFFLRKVDSKPDRLVIDIRHPGRGVTPSPTASADSARNTAPLAPRTSRRIGPESFGDFLVMVDAGHGGEDPGRRNPGGVREKDLALEFAKALKDEIDRRPGFRAELTRDGDYFVSLERRRRLSEEKGAHLYVSVHFNAAPSKAARGTEIFFVSLEGATDRALKELEDVENSADLVGGLPPSDATTSNDLAKMIVDLRQNDSVERSQRLATLLTDKVEHVKGIETRRVKQAGFAVLKSLFIPAVLVEVGFLTNDHDVRFVRSKSNRANYVRALADGVVAYCEEIEIPRIGWRMHTVAKGETLTSIASKYGMETAALRQANGIGVGAETTIREARRLRVKPR